MRKRNVRQGLRAAAVISCACAAALTLPNRSTANATWLAHVSGNWTDATKWSTSSYYPDSADDSAIINAAGSPYTVAVDATDAPGRSITINTLNIDSADATVSLQGDPFTVTDALTISHGTFAMRDGTLSMGDGSLNSPTTFLDSGTLDISGGTCDLSGTWDSSAGTINLSGGQINLGGPGFDLSKIGTFNRTGGNVYLTGTFNNTNGTTADLTDKVGTWLIGGAAQIDGGTIVPPDNNSLPVYLPLGTSLTVNSAAINSAVVVDHGSTLTLLGSWTMDPKSILLRSGSTMVVGGNFTGATLGAVNHDPDVTFRIIGDMDNSGNTINENGSVDWQLAGGIVSGGAIACSTGQSMEVLFTGFGSSSTLDDVALSGNVLLDFGVNLRIANGLGGVGSFEFTSTYNPVANQNASGPSPAWAGLETISAGNAPLTIGGGITIETSSGSGSLGTAGYVLSNHGLISAHTFGQQIIFNGSVNNDGIIEAGSGGSITTSTESFISSGTIRVDTGGVMTINGPLSLTAGSIGGDGLIDAMQGALVSGRVVKTGDGVLDINNGLTISSGARLDMSGGGLIVRHPVAQLGTWNGSTYTDLTGLIQSGRNGGTWDGPGVMTSDSNGGDHNEIGIASAAQALGISATQTGTWMSQSVNGSDVLVMYTYGGDANLDGKINIDDYGRIDASVGQSGSVFGWYNGDFNYDGKINIDDYGIIDSNIGSQGPPLGIAPASLAGIAQADGITAVPEPASILLLLLPLLAQPARRRRCKI